MFTRLLSSPDPKTKKFPFPRERLIQISLAGSLGMIGSYFFPSAVRGRVDVQLITVPARGCIQEFEEGRVDDSCE